MNRRGATPTRWSLMFCTVDTSSQLAVPPSIEWPTNPAFSRNRNVTTGL
jgi:hypothetical protein